jgi:hypothetical protein
VPLERPLVHCARIGEASCLDQPLGFAQFLALLSLSGVAKRLISSS